MTRKKNNLIYWVPVLVPVTISGIGDGEPRIELDGICYTALNCVPYIKFPKFLEKILTSFPLAVCLI